MRWQLSLLLLAAGTLVAADTPADDAKKALEQLRGGWKVEKAEMNGKAYSEDVVKTMTVEFKDRRLTIKDGPTNQDAEIKLDPTMKPATIDLTVARGAKETVKGIYELNGDTLTLCWARKERPTAFESKPGGDVVLLVLKRAKK